MQNIPEHLRRARNWLQARWLSGDGLDEEGRFLAAAFFDFLVGVDAPVLETVKYCEAAEWISVGSVTGIGGCEVHRYSLLSPVMGDEWPDFEGAGKQQAGDDDPYVFASKLWPQKFERYRDCVKFLATSSIRTKGKGRRRLIHAADWANHWAAVDKAAFDALENFDGEPIVAVTAEAENLVKGARERYRKTAAKVRGK